MCSARVANGGRSRRTCPRAARSTAISIGGTTTERCSAFIMRSSSSVVSRPGARLVRRRPSSTARASRARKRGALNRPVGLRRGQEGQGEEAPCPRRHTRLADARPRACSRRAGPGRWRGGHGPPLRAVPVSAQALRRRRLSGAAVPGGFAPRLPPRPGGDRQAIRSGQGLRGPAKALDCRTHHSLAKPLPSAGQGLGVPQPQGSRLPALGFHSPYAPKALSHNKMIPDRLLEELGRATRERCKTYENEVLSSTRFKDGIRYLEGLASDFLIAQSYIRLQATRFS